MQRKSHELQPGDKFIYRTEHPAVTVIRTPENTVDIFGRNMHKIWCSAEGREGYIILGPDVNLELEA